MSWKKNFLRAGLSSDGYDIEAYRGVITAMNLIGAQGNTYYVDPTNGSDNNDGKSPDNAVASLSVGYAKLTAGQNDTLVYLAGTTSLSIEDTLDWAKDYTHFIGIAAPTHMAQRARIFNDGNTSASTPLLKVSGDGCIFENLYIFQGSAVATVGCVEVTGGRNYFSNVHFAGMGHATNSAGANAYSLKLNGAEECMFDRCTIGIDAIKRTGDNNPLWFDGGALRNHFKQCRFVSWAEDTTYAMVTINDTTALDRFTEFEDCKFYNFWTNHGNTLAEAFAIPSSMTTMDILISGNSALFGIDEWDSNDRAGTWISGPAPAAATSGIAVKPAT